MWVLQLGRVGVFCGFVGEVCLKIYFPSLWWAVAVEVVSALFGVVYSCLFLLVYGYSELYFGVCFVTMIQYDYVFTVVLWVVGGVQECQVSLISFYDGCVGCYCDLFGCYFSLQAGARVANFLGFMLLIALWGVCGITCRLFNTQDVRWAYVRCFGFECAVELFLYTV